MSKLCLSIYYDIPEKSDMVPSESTLRFSELSAVPIEASDSRVSSSDARGSRVSISKVNSSLQKQTLSGSVRIHNSVKAFCKFSASFLQNRTNVNTVVHLQYKSFTVDVTFAEHFKCSDCIYFSFCRLSICSVNTLSSCCMAAC